MPTLAERVGIWVAILTVSLALLGIVFQAGRIVDNLTTLREDFLAHERYWLEWVIRHTD